MRKINKFGGILNQIYGILATIFLGIIIISSFTQVFTRYVMNNSLSWTEECARYSFMWCSMLAAPIAITTWSHAAVTYLEAKLHGKVKRGHEIIVHCLVIFASALIIVEGVNASTAMVTQYSSAMRIPMQYVYMCVPVGGAGLLIQTIIRLLNILFPADDSKA